MRNQKVYDAIYEKIYKAGMAMGTFMTSKTMADDIYEAIAPLVEGTNEAKPVEPECVTIRGVKYTLEEVKK